MVLTLGVIIEETSNAYAIHNYVREDSWCNYVPKGIRYSDARVKFCNKVKEADPWYYILLFATDIVFVLCVSVTLVLFADWIFVCCTGKNLRFLIMRNVTRSLNF